LGQLIHVSADDLSNLWISTDGLSIHAEYDALSVARYLDGAGANGFGNQLAAPAWPTACLAALTPSGCPKA